MTEHNMLITHLLLAGCSAHGRRHENKTVGFFKKDEYITTDHELSLINITATVDEIDSISLSGSSFSITAFTNLHSLLNITSFTDLQDSLFGVIDRGTELSFINVFNGNILFNNTDVLSGTNCTMTVFKNQVLITKENTLHWWPPGAAAFLKDSSVESTVVTHVDGEQTTYEINPLYGDYRFPNYVSLLRVITFNEQLLLFTNIGIYNIQPNELGFNIHYLSAFILRDWKSVVVSENICYFISNKNMLTAIVNGQISELGYASIMSTIIHMRMQQDTLLLLSSTKELYCYKNDFLSVICKCDHFEVYSDNIKLYNYIYQTPTITINKIDCNMLNRRKRFLSLFLNYHRQYSSSQPLTCTVNQKTVPIDKGQAYMNVSDFTFNLGISRNAIEPFEIYSGSFSYAFDSQHNIRGKYGTP